MTRTAGRRCARLVVCAALAALCSGAAGCSRPGDASPAPSVSAPGIWASTIDAVLAESPSDFHTRVLADGRVTQAEFQEAQDLFAGCLAEHGVVVDFPDGPADDGYTLDPDPGHPSADVDAAQTACAPGTIDGVAFVYYGMRSNPEGIAPAVASRACLTEHGLTDFADLSDAEFAAALDAGTLAASTPQGALCLQDPMGRTVLTPAGAWDAQAQLQGRPTP